MKTWLLASERIFEILDIPITVKSPEDFGRKSTAWPSRWTNIEFKDVHFSYGDKNVLGGINLKVKRGEVIAIVGSSGAGKTTLIGIITSLVTKTSGKITVFDKDMDADPEAAFLKFHGTLVGEKFCAHYFFSERG